MIDQRALIYYYIYLNESRDSTPYSESPVLALQELSGVSVAENGFSERNTVA